MVSCESNSKAAKVDNCGVCNGNNSSCKKQREIIWPRSGNNRTVVYTLPVGSTHIKSIFSLKAVENNMFSRSKAEDVDAIVQSRRFQSQSRL